MLELFNKIPITVQVILLVTFVLACIGVLVFFILALVDAIEGNRERDRRERQDLRESVLRIARACERIGDILATTELLSTVEVTEERVVPYD